MQRSRHHWAAYALTALLAAIPCAAVNAEEQDALDGTPAPALTDESETDETEADASESMEEIVVEADGPLGPDDVRDLVFITHIHNAHREGGRLYSQKRYKEAFPYLLEAAQQGFKTSQFRLAYLYRTGLGAPYDPTAAIGWLGVSARGQGTPEMKRVYREIWERVPLAMQDEFLAIVDQYVEQYGNETNRTACRMTRKAGTYVKRMTCEFVDERLYADYETLLEDLSPDTAAAPPPPPPPPPGA